MKEKKIGKLPSKCAIYLLDIDLYYQFMSNTILLCQQLCISHNIFPRCTILSTALRAMNNRLREDANRLELEVDALHEEIDILKPEAERYVPFPPAPPPNYFCARTSDLGIVLFIHI